MVGKTGAEAREGGGTGPETKRLGRKNARRQRGKNFMGQRGALAKVRFVSEEIGTENSRSTRGYRYQDIDGRRGSNLAVHTPSKTERIGNLKIGSWVNWETCRCISGRRGLVTTHSLLHRGHERMREV